ncbi:MAG: lysophospholipase [bacterium]|nr:lysophospholipase [bacterium]
MSTSQPPAAPVDLHLHDATFPGTRAVVAIVHGYAEHGGRYRHLSAALRPHGFGTLAGDLRGHGRSPGRRGHVRHFTDYHTDVRTILSAARERAAGAPVFLFGHSMGGLVVLDLLATGDTPRIDGLLLSSPFLGVGRRVRGITRAFAKLLDVVWPTCPLPSGLDPAKVCRDEELQRLYGTDDLVFRTTTPRWFFASTRAIARVHAARLEHLPPMLLQFAGDDRVVDADRTREFIQRNDLESSSIEYGDCYHELLNEPPNRRTQVIARIVEQLETWCATATEPPRESPAP